MSWRRRIEAKLDALIHIATTELRAMINVADLIKALNDNTNAVAKRLDDVLAKLAASALPDGSVVVSADQLQSIQAVSDHLKQLGADPANPVPPAFPAGSADAGAAPAAASTPGPTA